MIALSVYLALYRLELSNGGLRFRERFSGNRTVGRVSERPHFDGDDLAMRVHFRREIDGTCSVLEHDYYASSCPSVERVIRKIIRETHRLKPSIAPSLIRVLFHDCFIEGCDASVLLDSNESLTSEKEAGPNLSLKGLEVIDMIKSELEKLCPGVVSCADIVVLSARESVKLAGGPRYPLKTGRKDSVLAFKERAERELPSPHASLSEILSSFYSKGFNEREVVCLSGAHSIGVTHCTFFEDRLYNFSGTGKPDPKLDTGFLQQLKTTCPLSASSAPAPSEPSSTCLASKSHSMSSENRSSRVVDLSFNNEGGDRDFGIRYYTRLLENKGVMTSDQMLTAREETMRWVRAYSSDPLLFRKDFASVMIRLSSYRVLTGSAGIVKKNCSTVF